MLKQQPIVDKLNRFSHVLNVIVPYQNRVETLIETHLHTMGAKSPLRDACEYALTNGGKRFRPALVLMMAKALGCHLDVSFAALAIEFFHTASLIADDLPCMDNDDVRRNKPSLHKVYGEATALLASYALISAGYDLIAKNAALLNNAPNKDKIFLLAIETAAFNTGIQGTTGGQFLDLYPPDNSLSTVKDVIQKKTVSLFEISFVFGWLFGGGDLNELACIKKAAYHFGRAFQIADDLDDIVQDNLENKAINLAVNLGYSPALQVFRKEISLYKETLSSLKGDFLELLEIADLLSGIVEKQP